MGNLSLLITPLTPLYKKEGKFVPRFLTKTFGNERVRYAAGGSALMFRRARYLRTGANEGKCFYMAIGFKLPKEHRNTKDETGPDMRSPRPCPPHDWGRE